MTKSADNLRFYGDLDSAVYRGDKGVTMPTALADPDTDDFIEVGWLADDGIDFDRDTESSEVNAYQANKVLRNKTTIKTEKLKFMCLEDNLAVLGIAYPGADIVTATGVTTITPSGAATDNAAWVVDVIDGAVTKRYKVTDGDATLAGTINHKSTDPTIFVFELTLNDYVIVSNNAAYDPA
jgi:hypothetical protein